MDKPTIVEETQSIEVNHGSDHEGSSMPPAHENEGCESNSSLHVPLSPSLQWLSSTKDAIELLEKKANDTPDATATAGRAYLGSGDYETDRSPSHSHVSWYRPKSEGELTESKEVPTIDRSGRLKIQSNSVHPKSRLSVTAATAMKPPSILKHPSRHKRCASLGQTIRYIDEVPANSAFSPLTCPSTPNAFNAPSCNVYNCDTCTAGCIRRPSSFSALRAQESDHETSAGLPATRHENYHRMSSFCCSGCGSSRRTPDGNGENGLLLENGCCLVPPLEPTEQLSIMGSCGHIDRPFYYCTNADNSDRQSLYSISMEKDFRYYFQHPYTRIFIAYFVTFCNWLIFAEDPISHSPTECDIPVVGNVISFIATKYPPEWPWQAVKVSLWVAAVFTGLIVGKYFVHHMLLRRILRLKMFRDEEGTWMIMILSMFISCYIFSVIYNFLLLSAHPAAHRYVINTRMGVSNANFMKAAACGTWLGDFFTAWMVTDMMLQDNLYPSWASSLRSFWRKHGYARIVVFWGGSVGMTAVVVYLIVSDDISWDNLNQDFIQTTELSRAFLASSILVMDLLIVMQDWDFPHFVCDLDIKLPGLQQASYTLEFFKKSVNAPEMYFHITGKWFNYGLIVVVLMLDLNMWKNQIIYYPPLYGQYIGPDNRVYTVSDRNLLATGNHSLWTYAVRSSAFDPLTNKTYLESDLKVNSQYHGYPAYVKSLAFLPCAAGFVLFFTLIYQYGRFPPKTDVSAGGRLRKRNARSSSWRRERRDSRLGGYISWRGITEYSTNRLGVGDLRRHLSPLAPANLTSSSRVNSDV